MVLYHGSNMEVSDPKILKRLRTADFGTGFYVTSNREQTALTRLSFAKSEEVC